MELLELKTKLLAIFNLETVEEMPDYPNPPNGKQSRKQQHYS